MVRHVGLLWRRGVSRSAAARAFAALLRAMPLDLRATEQPPSATPAP